MRAATKVDFVPTAAEQMAGLTLRQNERNHYDFVVTGFPKRRIDVRARVLGETQPLYSEAIPDGAVSLDIESFPDGYAFGYAVGDGLIRNVARASTAPLSSEKAGGFTGVFIGMYAAVDGGGTMPPADFAWFDYEPLDK